METFRSVTEMRWLQDARRVSVKPGMHQRLSEAAPRKMMPPNDARSGFWPVFWVGEMSHLCPCSLDKSAVNRLYLHDTSTGGLRAIARWRIPT